MRRTAMVVLAVSALVAPLGCTKAKPTEQTFCKELRHTSSLTQVLAGLQSDDASTIGRKAREAAQQFIKLKRSAPREIRSDVTQISDLVTKVAKAVEGSPDDPEAIAAVLRSESLNSLGAYASGQRVIDYSRKTCHVDLAEPDGAGPTTTAPETTIPTTPTT